MLAVIDYGVGNLGSIANMLKKINVDHVVTSDPGVVAQATKIVFPGVGSFDHGRRRIDELGLIDGLNLARASGAPILGICVGMQLMARRSDEGKLPGLGWFDADVIRFGSDQPGFEMRVPHMGWNDVTPAGSRLFEGLENPRFYFAHSFHFRCDRREDVAAQTQYGVTFPSAVCKENLLGVQFHPEKSHRFGLRLLKNFAEI